MRRLRMPGAERRRRNLVSPRNQVSGERLPRRGVSLIELLIVMTVLSVILTTSCITLHRLLQAQSAGTAAIVESLSVSRLARDLRRDAHAASAAELSTGDGGVTLTLRGGPDEAVVYRSTGVQFTRRVERPGAAPLNEDYRLGAVAIELELAESSRLITLRLRKVAPSQTASPGLATALSRQPRTLTTIQAALPATQAPSAAAANP